MAETGEDTGSRDPQGRSSLENGAALADRRGAQGIAMVGGLLAVAPSGLVLLLRLIALGLLRTTSNLRESEAQE